MHTVKNAKKGPITGFGEKMTDFEARHILNVGPDSDTAAIRLAHVRLIRIHHPDKGSLD